MLTATQAARQINDNFICNDIEECRLLLLLLLLLLLVVVVVVAKLELGDIGGRRGLLTSANGSSSSAVGSGWNRTFD